MSFILPLIFTAIYYIAFPFVFGSTRIRPISDRKFRLICIAVNTCLCLGIQLLAAWFYPDYQMSFAPAFIWSAVGILIGTFRLHKRHLRYDIICLLQVLLSCHDDSLYRSGSLYRMSNEEQIAYVVFYYRTLCSLGRTPVDPQQIYTKYGNLITYGFSADERRSLYQKYDSLFTAVVTPGIPDTFRPFIARVGYNISSDDPPSDYISANYQAIKDTIDYINGNSDYDPGVMNTPIRWQQHPSRSIKKAIANSAPSSLRSRDSGEAHLPKKQGIPLWVVIILVLIIGILIGILTVSLYNPNKDIINGAPTSSPTATASQTASASPTSTPIPTSAPTVSLSRPITGTVFITPFMPTSSSVSVRGLNVNDCYVRFHSTDSTMNDISFYIRSKGTASLNIPAGRYELYYAVGKDWQGYDAEDNMVFGPETQWWTTLYYYDFVADSTPFEIDLSTSFIEVGKTTERVSRPDLPF